MATIKTAAQLRAELKKNGVRLPHGYDVVKRKPKAKKATAVKKKATVTKRKSTKKTAKQSVAQKKFAANAKRAANLVKTGKAKDTKQAWKQIKMEF